ncbi:MAG: Cdc6/Cdc18 family protein [Thermoplasmata archaeon]
MIIRKPDALETSFVPEKLLYRDKEIETIRNSLLYPMLNGIMSNFIIYGDSGTGKTVTMRYLARETKTPFIIYENAISYRSIKNVLIDILAREGMIASERSSYANIFSRFSKVAEKYGKSMVLIIDEASNILRNDPEGIYYLFRAKDSFGVSISTAFIMMEDPAMFLDSKIRKSYGIFNEIKFRRYSRDELYHIALDRAERSLIESSYDSSILDYISEISSEFGSARYAIDILQKAAYIAEYRKTDRIEYDDVRAAKSMMIPFVTESKLAELDADGLLTLLAVCRCLSESSRTNIECVSHFRGVISEQYGYAGNSDIYESIRNLENMGIINSALESHGRANGVSKLISIYDVPVSVLTRKVENLLNGIF